MNTLENVKFEPASEAGGVCVSGVDLSQPLPEATFAAIERAFDRAGVLFFRDQKLNASHQIAFAQRFGELEVNFNSDLYGLPDHPEIFVIGNVEENGKAVALKGVGTTWHSDMCYTALPPRATMLYALEVPVLNGLALGDTCFANAALAWDALPPAMQATVEGRQAVFDFRGRKRDLYEGGVRVPGLLVWPDQIP